MIREDPKVVIPTHRIRLFDEVHKKREEQDKQHGGPSHDDNHEPWDWGAIILRHAGLGMQETVGGTVSLDDILRLRRKMVDVAAIAIAAIESIDRKLAPKGKVFGQPSTGSGF